MSNSLNDQKQAGIIPYRRSQRGLEILLVTSSTRKRWIIPKGNIEPHLNALESARKEAFEEAGVRGRVRGTPFGSYLHDTAGTPTEVEVFLMEVEHVLSKWPEEQQREREWVTVATAFERILESGLKRLILELNEEVG